jgi:hypothetical protein
MKIYLILSLIIFLYYCFISANPWKEYMTKAKIYDYIPVEYKLKQQIVDKNTDLSKLKYPLIFKPIICNGTNKNIKKINNKNEALDYIKNSKEEKIIVQEFYDSKYEVGLLYERFPFNRYGKIKSITLKENKGEWKPLRCDYQNKNIGVNCYKLKTNNIKRLTSVINKISNCIPNFFVGRYDIRFDNFDDFYNGKNFKIIELNGVMGYDLSTLITENKIKQCLQIIEWIFIRIIVGFQNIILFNGINIFDFFNIKKRYIIYKKCNDFEHLFSPSSC